MNIRRLICDYVYRAAEGNSFAFAQVPFGIPNFGNRRVCVPIAAESNIEITTRQLLN